MKKSKVQRNSQNTKSRFFNWICKKISALFELEEVEVTFIRRGDHWDYTYTKLPPRTSTLN